MIPEIRTLYDTGRPMQTKAFASACYAPFTTLEFGINGDVIACWKSAKYILGHIPDNAIDEIWHGEAVRRMRAALREYRFDHGCDWCGWQVKVGDFQNVYARHYDYMTVEESKAQWPQNFFFNIGNACNYACIMCSGDVSSTFRAKIEKRPPKIPVYTDPFFEQLETYIPYLKYASFFGGEPFLVPENFRVWDQMIRLGSRARIHINTNGSIVNERVRYYLEKLNVLSIGVSIDGAGKQVFENVRRYSHFETVVRNLDFFANFCKERKGDFHFVSCVIQQNWWEAPDIFLWAERYQAPVTMNMVTYPNECTLYSLGKEKLEEVYAVLKERWEKELKDRLGEANRISFEGLLTRIYGKISELDREVRSFAGFYQ